MGKLLNKESLSFANQVEDPKMLHMVYSFVLRVWKLGNKQANASKIGGSRIVVFKTHVQDQMDGQKC